MNGREKSAQVVSLAFATKRGRGSLLAGTALVPAFLALSLGGAQAQDLTNPNGHTEFIYGTRTYDDVTNGGRIINGGRLRADDVTNKKSGVIVNKGKLTVEDDLKNRGLIVNDGRLRVEDDLTNKKHGLIVNEDHGKLTADDLTNSGRIINEGRLRVEDDLTNKKHGLIVNEDHGKLTADDLTNRGRIINEGGLRVKEDITNQKGGVIVNSGLVKAGDDITNTKGGKIINKSGGVVTADDDLKNETGGRIVNGGQLNVGDNLVNRRGGAIINRSGGEIDVGSNIINGFRSSIFNGQGAVIHVTGDVRNYGRIVNDGTFNDDLINAGFVVNNGAFNANTQNFGVLVNNNKWTGNLDNVGIATLNNGSHWIGTVNNGGTLRVSGTADVTGTVNNGTAFGNDNFGLIKFVGPSPQTSTLNISSTFNANPGFSGINTTSDLSTVPGTAGKVVSVGNSGSTLVEIDRAAGTTVVLGNPTAVIANTGGPKTGTVNASATPDSTALGSFGLVNVTFESGGNGNWDLVRRLNVGAAAAPGAAILGALTAVEAAFQQSAPYVASSQNQNPDTWTAGVWSRVGGGQMTIKSTAQDSLGGFPASMRVKTTYDAYEVGVDTGRLDINNSGWNGHFGILGGSMSATANEQLTGTNVKVDAPFAGAYGVLVNGPIALNFVGRYNWIDTHVTDVAANLNNSSLDGHSFNLTASGAYNIALPNHWFVAPTAGINFTQADFGQLATNVGQQSQGIVASSITYDTLTSALVHAGARFGTTFQAADNLVLQPFGTLSVWHEMAGNWGATFAQQGGLADQFNVSRAGTFGQAGLGVVAQIPGTGFSGFARGDVQFGDKVDGTSVVGGLRYNFGP